MEKGKTKGDKTWTWLTAAAVAAAAIIGIVGSIDVVTRVAHIVRPEKTVIRCQDDPDCVDFILRILNHRHKGVVNQSGNPPGQPPGGGRPPPHKPPPSPPPKPPPPRGGILDTVCHINLLGVRVCVKVGG